MSNPFDLTGKVAIVTGCDTGLGRGIALALAEAGCGIFRGERGRANGNRRMVKIGRPPFPRHPY